MCWSLQASLITWLIGLVTGIVLLIRRMKNDITLGLLILTYSSMQLWESMMWYDQKCGKINAFATKAAYYALWSHVLAVGIGLYIEYKTPLPLWIGIFLMILGIIYSSHISFSCSLPGTNKHLAWGFDAKFYMLVFAVAIILCLLYIRPFSHAMIVSGLFIASYIACYIYAQFTDPNTVGSFWCWIAAAFSFVFLVLPLTNIK